MALKEAEEFAAEYAPVERKKPVRKIAVQDISFEPVPLVEKKIYGSDSEEFASALRSVSPELLRLVKDQFNLSPSALVTGIFQKPNKGNRAEISDSQEQEAQEFQNGDEEISD